MKKKFVISTLFTYMIFLQGLFAAGVERYAIYIGANNGGKGRQQLLYAGTDAQSFKNAMEDVGGISGSNSVLLINPTKKDVNKAIEEISKKIENNKQRASRTEFIFYYSGHSDEGALLLGENKYDYSSLKQTISDIPSDIHVVILDSCYSGNFIRTKGGQKQKPFLMDDSSVVKGHAYLSSSSETESSQESDEIGASYFTNSIITGLRGAADTTGDKKVTLNELYSYAFNETLKKTEDTLAGPQHPTYNITLVGSGDLILSDFSESDSVVSIAKEVTGKVIIRDNNGKLVSEINKNDEMPVMLALPEGKYSVVIIGDKTMQGEITVKRDEAFVIDNTLVAQVETKKTTSRGGSFEDADEEAGEEADEEIFYKNRDVKEHKFAETILDDDEDDDDSSDRNGKSHKNEPKSNILPIDFEFKGYIPFSTDSEGAFENRWYMRDNMIIPDVTNVNADFRIKLATAGDWSFFTGVGVEAAYLEYNSTYNEDTQLSVSPIFGVYKNLGGFPFEGIGMSVYPFYNYTVYETGRPSYYSYQSALQFDANFCVINNLTLGIFERVVMRNSKTGTAVSSVFGMSLGFISPSKRTVERVRNTRDVIVTENSYNYHLDTTGSDEDSRHSIRENRRHNKD